MKLFSINILSHVCPGIFIAVIKEFVCNKNSYTDIGVKLPVFFLIKCIGVVFISVG